MNALLKQDAHLDVRRGGRLTGSRIGAVLGLNPYSKREDVLREMVRQHFGAPQEFEGNEATRYGQAKEPEALAKYEAQAGVMTYGGGELLIHPLYDFLAVTPDGLVGSDGMIECKAPFRGNYTHWQEKPYYEAQMHLQMECARRKWCDFAVLQRDGSLHVSRLRHDPDWLPSNLGVIQNFMDDYADAIASREAAARFLGDKERDDKAWRNAANDYLNAVATMNDLEAIVKSKREILLALAGDSSAKGAGVQVIRSERAGTVAYAKAIKDLAPDADLSAYTSKPSIVFTVKECK
jgi:putative phage-type endonuclease